MGTNLSRRVCGTRGLGRAVALLALLLAGVAAGCGGGEDSSASDSQKESDAELLNAALAHELTVLDLHSRGRAHWGDSLRPVGRRLRAHQGEYANALTKAIRGLGAETEAEPAELDLPEVEDRDDFVALVHRLEGESLDIYLDAAPSLATPAPRKLAAALAAGHAQHLVVLRQALGAPPALSIPEPFGDAEIPPPADEGEG